MNFEKKDFLTGISIESFTDDDFREICREVNTRTFARDLAKIKNAIRGNVPGDLKICLGSWIYEKIWRMFKDKEILTEHLKGPIRETKVLPLKGAYLRYMSDKALYDLAEEFFLRRHDQIYFILQVLNDSTLINLKPLDDHFFSWIESVNTFEQQSVLLDVLLRRFPSMKTDEIHRKLRGGAFVTLGTDKQNAHDSELSKELFEVAQKIIADKPKFMVKEPKIGEIFVEGPTELEICRDKVREPPFDDIQDVVEAVFTRASIDMTLFMPQKSDIIGVIQGRAFSISDMLMATIQVIDLHPEFNLTLRQRLKEEFIEMNGLCSSAYILRFANVFSGLIPKYEWKLPEWKGLASKLIMKLSKAFENAPSEVTDGSSSTAKDREAYLSFIENTIQMPNESKQDMTLAIKSIESTPIAWEGNTFHFVR